MKVSGVGRGSTSSTKRAGKSRSPSRSFASHLDDTAGAVDVSSGPDAPASLAAISSILSVQTVDPDAGGGKANRRLMQRAEDLLDKLENVRHGLLVGAIPRDMLADLARMVRARRDAGGDPHLVAILDEIELRAEVELAKLATRSGSGDAARTREPSS
ncbi:flagellar assembly protein FliX [Haematospirillum sp. H1815]|uniref:flagellar assembly protein FliX n=1 Tax=Haematospirillum sp. H1815 TaxID=2723108 RepID=UPI00143C1E74|nr:flagellar assembly protein FliX [Haematospirillum sp. H1815]NKD77629.1 flagellar assembly protein FliX [Haematospirillum sp. H1815]